MRFENAQLAITLPDGYRAQGNPEDLSFVHDGLQREIVLSSFQADERTDVAKLIVTLSETRRTALGTTTGLAHSSELQTAVREGVHEGSFLAVSDDPLIAFCAVAIDERPLLGRLHGATVCLYQYASKKAGPPDVEIFAHEARALLASLVPVPQRAVLERATAAAPAEPNTVNDPTRLFPYLIPRGYVDAQTVPGPLPRTIGHGVYLAVAEDFDGAVAVHYAERLRGLGSPDEILDRAQQNLVAALRARKVSIQGFDGPRGARVLVFGPEWMAASCLFLPDLYTFAASHVGPGPLLVSVPHRDAMLIFRDLDDAYRQEMQAFVAKNEADGRKPLTGGLFRLTAEGIEAV